jgi:hypothetical protein
LPASPPGRFRSRVAALGCVSSPSVWRGI